jgi:adenosylcobyric acid synthase
MSAKVDFTREVRPILASHCFKCHGQDEGARSPEDLILGTYLHGLFDHPDACHALLKWAGLQSDLKPDLAALREQSIDRIADACEPLLAALQRL